MNRKEFLKMLGIGAGSDFVVVKSAANGREKIISKDPGRDYEELFQIMSEDKLVSIAGINFKVTEMNLFNDGRRSIELSLSSHGE